jgi:hypothetical protein
MDRWLDFNGSNSFFPAAVRVGYDPEIIFQQLKRYSNHTYKNGYQLSNPHGIENWSTVPNTVNEMLCMGHQDVVRLFSGWPKDKDAEFYQIRVEGAFLVSAKLKSGEVSGVILISERGRDLNLLNPWKNKKIKIKGKNIGGVIREEVREGERIKIKTIPGATYFVEPVLANTSVPSVLRSSAIPKRLSEIDIHYCMLDKNEIRELPPVHGRTYLSGDSQVVSIAGNKITAQASGDCIAYSVQDGEKKVFARVTVDWPVQNPVLPYSWKMYIPDSEAHVFKEKLYVYGSLDDSKGFCSPYLMPVATNDMKRWESRGVAFSTHDKSLPYPNRSLWGSDVHFYNGKYLLYGAFEWFGEQSENHIYILESENPMGPFKNFRWVTGNKTKKEPEGITGKVFVEKDGTRYMIWAPTLQPVRENYLRIAKLLKDDVIDADNITDIKTLKDFYEGPSIRKRGDTYYLIYDENCGPISAKNHTPKRLSYATSKSITGEYVYRGVLLTIEDLPGNINIQGSIEEFGGKWYLFYHRGFNNMPMRRALCIEKIEFDKDGLIRPVVPTSSGISEGLDPARTIYFNTAVIQKNFRFSNDGRYGSALVNGSAEIGFRYVAFTGNEKTLLLQGANLEQIVSVKIIVNGELIGEGSGDRAIPLKGVKEGKGELRLVVTTKGKVRLETLKFGSSCFN